MMKKKIALGVLCGMALLANSAYAEEALQSYSLDQVIVTATKDEVKDLEVPAMTQVYQAEDIERTGANDVLEFVKNTLGAEITDVSAPAKNGVHFRGTGSMGRMRTSALLLIDGIPMNIQGRADLPSIPTSAIQRIEIINGGGSVLYGTDALDGGVINVILKDKFDGQATYGYGTHGKRIGGISYGAGDDKTSVNFAWNHSGIAERGHNDILGASTTPSKVRYGGKYESDSFLLTAKYDNHLKYIGMVKQFSNDYYYRNATNQLSDPLHASQMHSLSYKNKDLNTNIYWKKYKLTVDDYTTKAGVRSRKQTSNNSSRVFGVDINDRFKFKNFELLLGANFENENINHSMNKYNRKQNTESIYMLLDANITKNTKVSVGGRQLFVEDLGSKFCPQFNVLHKLSENDSMFINVNKAYRTPLAEELFGNAAHGYTGNLNLRPETGWLSEIGYKRNIKNGNVKLAVFNTRINNRISKDATKTYVNMDKFKNTGVELVATQKLSKQWTYTAGITYANPQEASSGKWDQADYKFGLTSQLGYSVGKFSATVNAQYWAKLREDRPTSYTNTNAINVNANVKYDFDKHHSLKLNVVNLNDSEKYYCDSASLPKRSVYATYTYTF